VPPEKPYGSIDAMLSAEIGETMESSTAETIRRFLDGHPDALSLFEQAIAR
jgi:hypothetical protein